MAEEVPCRSMGCFPTEFLHGQMVWRLAAPVFTQFILSLRAAMCCGLFESGLTPDHTPRDNAQFLAGCQVAIDDPIFGQVIRRHFHVHVVYNTERIP